MLVRGSMRLALLLVLASVSTAHAGPLMVGVHAGSLQSGSDASAGYQPQSELGAFGRYTVTPRLAAQLGIAQASLRQFDGLSHVAFTGHAILDLMTSSKLVPTVLVGFGVESVSGANYAADARRSELGLGLEYRARNGFVVGLDARMGHRSVDGDQMHVFEGPGTDAPELHPPAHLANGNYRSARLVVGLRF